MKTTRYVAKMIVGMGCLLSASMAWAEDQVEVCFNYGCHNRAWITIEDADLAGLKDLFKDVATPLAERNAVVQAEQVLDAIAARTTPIAADKHENYYDNEGPGKRDCIDHSTTSTAYLQLMSRQGWLRFHDVGNIVVRHPAIFDYHRAALLLEGGRVPYVVDGWFRDFGQPVVVMPLVRWEKGDGAESDGIQADGTPRTEVTVLAHNGNSTSNSTSNSADNSASNTNITQTTSKPAAVVAQTPLAQTKPAELKSAESKPDLTEVHQIITPIGEAEEVDLVALFAKKPAPPSPEEHKRLGR